MSGMTALGHAVNIVKTLTGAVKELGKAEILTDLIDLQNVLLDIQQKQADLMVKNQELFEENRKLKAAADLQQHLTFDRFYTITGLGTRDGRYCSTCYDVRGQFVRLQ